jgi:hypothetical protein
LYEALNEFIGDPSDIELVYRRCGSDPAAVNFKQKARAVWIEALDQLTGDDALGQLCAVLRERFPNKASFQDTIVAFEGATAAGRARSGPAAIEPESTYHFDLKRLESSCFRRYVAERSGLLGFAVLSTYERLVTNLRDRLHDRIGRGRIKAVPLIPELNALTAGVDDALEEITDRERSLKASDLLFAVRVEEPGLAVAFWERLTAFWEGFSRDVTERRLVVILAVRPDGSVPSGVVALDPPRFDEDDLFDWMWAVIQARNWAEDAARAWRDAMLKKCRHQQELVVERVYYQLDRTIEKLKDNITEQEFLEKYAT